MDALPGTSGSGIYHYNGSSRKVIGVNTNCTPKYGLAVKLNNRKTRMLGALIDDYPNSSACEADSDGDGMIDVEDNCRFVFNPEQFDLDNDGVGLACDTHILINPSNEVTRQNILSKFTIYGYEGVSFNDRASLRNGQLIGGKSIEMGDMSNAGSLLAGSLGINIREHSSLIGSAITSGEIKTSNASLFKVSGAKISYASVELPEIPTSLPPDWIHIPPIYTSTIEKGEHNVLYKNKAYGNIIIKSGGILELTSTGNFVMRSLIMEPGSKLIVKGIEWGAPTRIFIKDDFSFRGKIEPPEPYRSNGALITETVSASHLLIVTFETGTIPIERTINATIVAPHGVLNISVPPAYGEYTPLIRGSFFAKYIFIHQDTIVIPITFAFSWWGNSRE
ncbi:MAG: thrombospondin type 3 repeat-containing protein [Deltaproteobacteria bacterium]|nr:thrombospondin type 3 repeat-containing protein [Deltaproteobacteria bacterium]